MKPEASPNNWAALRTVILQEISDWQNSRFQTEVRINTTEDAYEQSQLRNGLAVIGIYLATAEHYLEVMAQIEAQDGGIET